MNLFTALDQAAARFPDSEAVYHGEQRVCTWFELRERALRIASKACVVGAPDAEWDEVVVAFVVGSTDADELDAHMLQRIARFKRPKRYLLVEGLPKNSYGKVLKRGLWDRLAEQCSASQA